MIDLAWTIAGRVVGVLLCGVVLAAWWWETCGRREHEREMWRREMRAKRPRR